MFVLSRYVGFIIGSLCLWKLRYVECMHMASSVGDKMINEQGPILIQVHHMVDLDFPTGWSASAWLTKFMSNKLLLLFFHLWKYLLQINTILHRIIASKPVLAPFQSSKVTKVLVEFLCLIQHCLHGHIVDTLSIVLYKRPWNQINQVTNNNLNKLLTIPHDHCQNFWWNCCRSTNDLLSLIIFANYFYNNSGIQEKVITYKQLPWFWVYMLCWNPVDWLPVMCFKINDNATGYHNSAKTPNERINCLKTSCL